MAETYRSRRKMTARPAKNGERVVTWDGLVIAKEGEMVVTNPDDADVRVMTAVQFDERWGPDSTRITSIERTNAGYSVYFDDGSHQWYADSTFNGLLKGFSLSVTIGNPLPLTQTIGDVVSSLGNIIKP